MLYVIQIGHTKGGSGKVWYVGDDQPPSRFKTAARRYATREAAEIDAAIIRETWNLTQRTGPTVKVVVHETDRPATRGS